MHERRKLQEARYFLNHMRDAQLHSGSMEFAYELSAFLGAARSVLQYAWEEAKANAEAEVKAGGKATTKANVRANRHLAWYEAAVGGSTVLEFFRTLRNDNTHTEPAKSTASWERQRALLFPVGEDDFIPYPHDVMMPRHRLDDWSGDESALELCSGYLSALEAIVTDGIAKGHIAG
jgi:hypothetical protein